MRIDQSRHQHGPAAIEDALADGPPLAQAPNRTDLMDAGSLHPHAPALLHPSRSEPHPLRLDQHAQGIAPVPSPSPASSAANLSAPDRNRASRL